MAVMTRAATGCAAFERTEVISLAHNDLYCLPYGVLSIRVISGTAWVTSQIEDYVLEADDQMMIPRQPHTAIVSVIGHPPLRFEIRRR